MHLTLKILAGRHVGKELRVTKPKFLIGRGDDCHLRPTSGEISRHHAEIVLEDNLAFVRDCGSTNGTFVNGRRLTAIEQLHTGDTLILGPLMFEVVLPIDLTPTSGAEVSEWVIGDADVVTFLTDDDPSRASGRTRLLGARQLAEMMANDPTTADLAGPKLGPAADSAPPTTITDGPTPLPQHLLSAIDAYRKQHPGTSWVGVREALKLVLLNVERGILEGRK